LYNRSVSDIDIPPEGRVVHLRQYGFIKVFRIVHFNKEPEHRATDIPDASESDRKSFKDFGWNIENITGALSSVVGLRDARVAKRLSSEDIFFSRCWRFSVSNLIV
jgi:hypothetical protein